MKKTTKTNPIPVRLDAGDRSELKSSAQQTGLSESEIIRRCVRFALPAFESGAANLLDYGQPLDGAEQKEVA